MQFVQFGEINYNNLKTWMFHVHNVFYMHTKKVSLIVKLERSLNTVYLTEVVFTIFQQLFFVVELFLMMCIVFISFLQFSFSTNV